ncbi:ATP adenylyltransferase family protein [Trinickia fusca]|uniref:Phosphorylase n=1 Tax=Trinickia fusca TaxID=2419777 RepID=A0A494XCA2_9BURK|nr:phosphorylase [Trinickia fusca]RKP45163.1 phosphorylase [Trinickia fusca]
MPSVLLRPGTLWPAIVRSTSHALERGALRPIETVQTSLEDDGVRFFIRQVSSLVHKARSQAEQAQQPSRASVDPFLPYDPDLFVADISDTHVALLNKFNVIDHHLLIVTRAYESQEALLDLADFTAWCACLAEFDGLGFYNGGQEAGASQPHKHLQIVPLPLGDTDTALPIGPLIDRASLEDDIGTLPALPFAHAFARLRPAAHQAAPQVALACYRAMIAKLALKTTTVDGQAHQVTPYNLLMTPRWMLLVPRSVEHVEGLSVNALGFAGSLFVRDATQMQRVRELGPMTILQRATLPRTAHA